MYFDFCIGTADPTRRYPIDTIFYIGGDASYRTPHKEITPNKNYFVCTTKGTGVISLNGQSFDIHEGDCMVVRPNTDFSYHCKENCWCFWWFEFEGDCAPFTANTFVKTSVIDFKIDLFAQSLSYAKEGRWDIAALLFESACEILQHGTYIFATPPRTLQWDAATRFIRDNLQTVTVARLCEVLCINERTLRNMFHAHCGKAPKQMILKTRLDAGRQLLESTALPIAEIASQLGFSTQFHFSSAFKNRYDKSPLRYRNEFGLS